jgi:hypothetical protein
MEIEQFDLSSFVANVHTLTSRGLGVGMSSLLVEAREVLAADERR